MGGEGAPGDLLFPPSPPSSLPRFNQACTLSKCLSVCLSGVAWVYRALVTGDMTDGAGVGRLSLHLRRRPCPRALPWAASGLPNSWAEGTPRVGYHARCRKVHVESVLQAQV